MQISPPHWQLLHQIQVLSLSLVSRQNQDLALVLTCFLSQVYLQMSGVTTLVMVLVME